MNKRDIKRGWQKIYTSQPDQPEHNLIIIAEHDKYIVFKDKNSGKTIKVSTKPTGMGVK